MGKNVLGIESSIDWATPGNFTEMNDVKCDENGDNCGQGIHTIEYVDPSANVDAVMRRLHADWN